MAKQRSEPPAILTAITAERAARLVRFLHRLGEEPQTRSALMKKLRLDVRGFYRDLETLRKAGLRITYVGRKYHLEEPDVASCLNRLPLPDPHLTLGEARLLAKGRTNAHRKLKAAIDAVVPD